jgi:hypothetical protein
MAVRAGIELIKLYGMQETRPDPNKFMNKYNRITLYEERFKSFAERTISLLGRVNLPSDYDKELQDFHKGLLEVGCDGYSEAEDTMDFSASLADEYMLLSDGIYSAVLTAFFHLWERDIKDLCKRILRHRPVSERNKRVTEQELQNYKYKKLKSLLIFWGAKESIFREVNLLRLVVNTIKHSTGPSAAELLTNNSKYYYKLVMLCDLKIDDVPKDHDLDMLNIDDIKYFSTVVNSFWEELGKSILI